MFALTVFLGILGGLLAVAILSLLASFTLQIARWLVVKRNTQPERAFVSMFVVCLAATFLGLAIGALLAFAGPYGEAFFAPANIVGPILGLAITIGVLMPRHALSFGEAAKVTIVVNLIWLAVGILAALLWLAVRVVIAGVQGYINA